MRNFKRIVWYLCSWILNLPLRSIPYFCPWPQISNLLTIFIFDKENLSGIQKFVHHTKRYHLSVPENMRGWGVKGFRNHEVFPDPPFTTSKEKSCAQIAWSLKATSPHKQQSHRLSMNPHSISGFGLWLWFSHPLSATVLLPSICTVIKGTCQILLKWRHSWAWSLLTMGSQASDLSWFRDKLWGRGWVSLWALASVACCVPSGQSCCLCPELTALGIKEGSVIPSCMGQWAHSHWVTHLLKLLLATPTCPHPVMPQAIKLSRHVAPVDRRAMTIGFIGTVSLQPQPCGLGKGGRRASRKMWTPAMNDHHAD